NPIAGCPSYCCAKDRSHGGVSGCLSDGRTGCGACASPDIGSLLGFVHVLAGAEKQCDGDHKTCNDVCSPKNVFHMFCFILRNILPVKFAGSNSGMNNKKGVPV